MEELWIKLHALLTGPALRDGWSLSALKRFMLAQECFCLADSNIKILGIVTLLLLVLPVTQVFNLHLTPVFLQLYFGLCLLLFNEDYLLRFPLL